MQEQKKMSDEVYAFALKNTLSEIKNACPSLSHTFIFKDAKILASDEDTAEETASKAVNAFDALAKHANATGGIENATINGTDRQMNFTRINDLYLTNITSKESDERNVNTLTQILIPIVLKLVGLINPQPVEPDIITKEKTELKDGNVASFQEESLQTQGTVAAQTLPELMLLELPVTQLMIEPLSGLLVPSDTARIDNAVFMHWKNLYANRKIEEVEVETLNGKTTRCKFRPIKGSKHAVNGTIQMPEKIQLILQATKGELVMVKPVVK